MGALAGFLFGVPRMGGGEAGGRTPQVVSNTNLEQLSDWLTKILVGVGLVQIHQVDPLLSGFRDQIDRALTAANGHQLPGAGVAACLILIGSSVAGFLAAYLKSKTDLVHAFREPFEIVRSALGEVARTLIVDAARMVLNRPSSLPDDCSRDTAARLVQFAPPESDDPDLHQLVGLAHAVLKNFKPAADALRTAVELRCGNGLPDDLSLNSFATRALALAGDADVARAISPAILPSGAIAGDAVENALAAMFARLYARGGYDDAIGIGERLAQEATARGSGRLWLYLACAYGQRHAALLLRRQTGGDASEPLTASIGEARDKALAASREAIRLDRAKNEAVLRRCWDPASAQSPAEDDLASLHGDAAFVALFAADEAKVTQPPAETEVQTGQSAEPVR